jgi:hypothetical protein
VIQRPIFLLGAHKSGTSLLRSLLDGHPELFVMPFEAHFFELARFWVDYRLRRTYPPTLSLDQTREGYIELVRRYNTIKDPVGDNDLVGKLDPDAIEQELSACPAETLPELIACIIASTYKSLMGQPMPDHLRTVEKSVENAEFAPDLIHMFPDAKFIHIVRNPYSNLVAIRRKGGGKDYPFIGPAFRVLYNSFYSLYRNRRLIDDYQVVRYEDLLQQPEATVRSIADYLEIEFVDSLLRPTSLGQPWQGNSSRGLAFSGISAANLDLWRQEITPLEIHYVSLHFGFLLADYGYQALTPPKSRWWPVRGEPARLCDEPTDLQDALASFP